MVGLIIGLDIIAIFLFIFDLIQVNFKLMSKFLVGFKSHLLTMTHSDFPSGEFEQTQSNKTSWGSKNDKV